MYARSLALVALLAGPAEREDEDGSIDQDASDVEAEPEPDPSLPPLRPGVDLYDESTWRAYSAREKAKLRAEVERRNAAAEERLRRAREGSESETPEPTPSTAPPQVAKKKVCVREDFEDFDDYVACRSAGIPQHKAPPFPVAAAPAVEGPELPQWHRRELQELRDSEDYYRSLALGTLIPGGIVGLTGIAMIIAGSTFRERRDRSMTVPSGPNCVVGKRCGDACIEVSDTCHIATPVAPLPPLTKKGVGIVAGGVVTLAAGLGLVIAGSVAAARLSRVRTQIDVLLGFSLDSASVSIRF